MSTSPIRDNVERWLVHHDLAFKSIKTPENSFHILIRPAGQYGMPIEIFEPKTQPGTIVVGAKVVMANRQIRRYQEFTPDEKRKWEERVKDFCDSIHAINRNVFEDGKQKIGVYVVLEGDINQQVLLDAISQIAAMHERTARFQMKTF